jgi:hypothetical protein
MPGVPKRLIEHPLNVDPKATPKRQHLCCFAENRRDAIKKELAKLLVVPSSVKSSILSGSPTPSSSARTIPTSGGCVSTTPTSTRTYPKDPFGLPRIDQAIDSTAGCDLLCFLNCYSGYH